jgi:hypothetical protein
MRKYPSDITGMRFGQLTALSFVRRNQISQAIWSVRCDCGQENEVPANRLLRGGAKSCGCLRIKRTKEARTTHGDTVNGRRSAEYRAWCHIKTRCYNQKDKRYPQYGGRGITVCQRWLDSFEAFLSDMGLRPSSKHSINRIDNDGNYEKHKETGELQCHWATKKEQARNTSTTREVKFRGRTMALAEAAELAGISYALAHMRLDRGWDIERALCAPKTPFGRRARLSDQEQILRQARKATP